MAMLIITHGRNPAPNLCPQISAGLRPVGKGDLASMDDRSWHGNNQRLLYGLGSEPAFLNELNLAIITVFCQLHCT